MNTLFSKHAIVRSSKLVRSSRLVPLVSLLVLAGCGQAESPHIAMCHKIIEKAVGKVEWGESSVRESNIEKVVSSTFNIDGQSGNVGCTYDWERVDSDNGQWATAPTTVSINGQRMSFRELTRASFGASKDSLEEVAKETSKETQRVARETSERAGELAEQAGDKGRELAAEASERLAPAAERAGEVATQLGDQAKDVADEAARKLREALQNQ